MTKPSRRYMWDAKEGKMVEIGQKPIEEHHYVQPDLEPFKSVDNAVITSRADWREHLIKTECVEMGHSDMKMAQEKWNKRQTAHKERVDKGKSFINEHHQPVEAREYKRTNLSAEMANKLDNRPQPGRIEMIKLTLQTMKEMNTRGR